MIETYLWKQLVALAKYGTLSEVANRLNLSQSALSRSMQKLEQHIGVELFVRKKNSIALNDNGIEAAQFAEKILALADDALEKIREFDRKNRTIFIGSCAPVPLHEIIFLLTQDFPDVSINSELKDDQYLISGLQNNLFNLAILHERPNDEKFFSLKCGGEKLFLAVPHEHRFATKDGIFLEELNGEKVLLYSKIGFWYNLCLQKAPNAKFLMQSERDVFKELVEVSPFLSFTTDVLIKTGHAQKNCIYKPILNTEANVTYYCACKSNQKNRFKNLFTKLPSQNSPNQKLAYLL
ncbi:MAG: LysR family transcriptional regulator [Selenomonadaceae bacterium]|nr:LysR family transcriptional regulator [Selenomonadaceae bacterium]